MIRKVLVVGTILLFLGTGITAIATTEFKITDDYFFYISGAVTKFDNEPIYDVNINVEWSNFIEPSFNQSVKTDSNGEYEIKIKKQLAYERYTITASKEGYKSVKKSIIRDPQNDEYEINFKIRKSKTKEFTNPFLLNLLERFLVLNRFLNFK